MPIISLAATVLLTIAGQLGYLFWWLDLWANFRFHYFFAALLLALVFLSARCWKLACIGLVVAFTNAPMVEQPSAGAAIAEHVDIARPPIKIVSFNVLKSNQRYSTVRKFLRQEAADIVILQEVNAAWKSELKPLSAEFPYRFIRASESFYGLALFAKIPWESVTYLPFAETGGAPIIRARFRVAGRPFTFFGTKTFPPTKADWSSHRDQQLYKLGELAREISGPLILAGDLNATSWSHGFTAFLRGSGQQRWDGGGHGASWPAILGWAGIRIDHIMVNSDLRMLRQSIGPNIGSDHRPVIAVVGL